VRVNVLLDNLPLFAEGFLGTIALFLISAVGSLVFGGVLAAMRVSPVPFLRGAGTTYVNIARNTPLTLVLFFFAFAWNRLGIFPLSFFPLACIGLIVYTSAFVCEVLRSGVNTVPVGQAEASRALGFTFRQTLGEVILPQALRAVVPPLISVEIALLKNTTVAAGFSVIEAGRIIPTLNERGYSSLIGGLWVALGFVILVIPLTLLQNRLEKRFRVAR
jgi:glutamate transport system permease protein